jgi:hypothetical protein
MMWLGLLIAVAVLIFVPEQSKRNDDQGEETWQLARKRKR